MGLGGLFDLNTGQLRTLRQAIDQGKNTVVFYAGEYNRYHIASKLNRFFLYVAPDLVSARKAYEILTEYSDKEILLLPEREDVFLTRQVENRAKIAERMSALYKIQSGTAGGAVITAEGVLERYPKRELFEKNCLHLIKGAEYPFEELPLYFTEMGYRREERAETAASFSVRGDTIDLFPSGSECLVRLEFFGEELERIRFLEPETMLPKEDAAEFIVLPATDIIVPQEEVFGILNKMKNAKRNCTVQMDETIRERTERFLNAPSSPLNTFFLPFMRELTDTIYAYLPADAVVVFDDTKIIDDKLRLYKNAAGIRVKHLMQSHELLKEHTESVLSMEEAYDIPFTKLGFGRITSNVAIFRPDEVMSIKTVAVPPYHSDIASLYADLKNYLLLGAKVRIFVPDAGSLDAIRNTLSDACIGADTSPSEQSQLGIEVQKISQGFIYPQEKLVCIGYRDLSRKLEKSKSAIRKRQAFLLPEKGDFVVHEKHGIGISEGMQRVETSSGVKDYYVVLYRDGDRMYLPADQLDTLEKYNGADSPSLHRLGGAEFERVKKRVKESVKAMAIDLLSLYRARLDKKGYTYQPDTVWQKEMEDAFEYPETDDQLIAVHEIKSDMEKGKIMDRLLCGDVGFGKTEVALRAVFKTVVEGKQAVILAPTTILAQQHFNLVNARFNSFKIKTALLSRFVPPKEIKESLKRIAEGEVSVVVATHRVLGKDVKFHDLGLLVLDEEQRFGVEHKEKLKIYRNKVNILSLSATPIPRTLHMSLSGIRDISTIEAPPKNRLPVETYVTEYSESLLVDAVQKELNRGGQVFILYNRVRDIEKYYRHVCSLFPEDVNIIYAHGQLDEVTLEDRIKDFYDGKAQILISTTIIENGIDLPNANTLFVLDADNLGLSQLYQLRGRVGRSNVLAYAYFTVREGKVLTENAVKRLGALMENTELGAGFKIAMRDLEIRGAGNVLGREQHGQMEKVGYELYLKLVKQGIEELSGVRTKELKEVEMIIEGDNSLPEQYIRENRARVTFYKRIASLRDREEGQSYYQTLKEMYGKPPESVTGIIRIGVMKNLAAQIDVKRVQIGERGMGLFFYDNGVMTKEGIFDALSAFSDVSVLIPDNPPSILFRGKGISQKQRIKLVLDFLQKATEKDLSAD